MKIGIIGYGFVGQALHASLKSEPVIYDKYIKKYNIIDDIIDTGVVFVCVGTPLKDGKMDASSINDVLETLSFFNYEGLVVIKSTVHPKYIKSTYNLDIVSNPEFLNAYNSIDDFKNQKDVLIGGYVQQCKYLEKIYLKEFNLSRVPVFHYASFEEALIFKYLRNIRIAYEVMFNEFVQSTAGNYRKYNTLMQKMPVHVKNICLDGEHGFGGACLPKDIASYPEHELTKFLLDYNTEIRDEKSKRISK